MTFTRSRFKRDVPQYSFYGIALGALLLPAILLDLARPQFRASALGGKRSSRLPLSGDDE